MQNSIKNCQYVNLFVDSNSSGLTGNTPISAKAGYPQPKDEVVMGVFSCQLSVPMDSGNKRTLGDARRTQQIPEEDE
jgi:hypothetical protein